jgi:CheY-like chemotaxis protein
MYYPSRAMSIDFQTRRRLPASAPRPTILVVDADADTRALYRAIFPTHVYDVDECDDGAVALGHAIARRPDLIIMETHLSRIDGFALCRLLRADPLTRSIPIVVVTSAASPADGARAVQAGANQVLVKPCDPAAVANAVSHALDRSLADAEGAAKRVPLEEAASEREPAAIAPPPARLKLRGRSRGFQRHITTTPASAPPLLRCPQCDKGLAYQHSHIGGVNAQSVEQWDYFQCRHCGTYQYRHRTRKLKAI